MFNLPLISVIIIFYNAEKYLREAIESVFAQTYQAWELLLIDDGSTDKSTAIARHYAEGYSKKVRYFEHNQHRNCGKSISRNLGLSEASGEYIAILDSDDVWLPNILEEQVAILQAHPEASMVYGPIQYWQSWMADADDIRGDVTEALGVPADTSIEPPKVLTLFLQDKAAVPSALLVRRQIIETVGGFEPAFRDFYEDQVFVAKICLKFTVFASGRCWYRYRQHPDSSCAIGKDSGEYFSTRPKFLNWLEEYVSEQQIKDPELWRALHEELQPYRHPTLYTIQKIRKNLMIDAENLVLQIGRRTLPAPLRHWLWARWKGQDYRPLVGWARLGHLRRVTPLSREAGYDRGRPIDRYYIEKFLTDHQLDIQGQVLEIADNTYTCQFGRERVKKSDILHVVPGNPKATLVGDLTCADHIPSDTFDCIILTQTLQLIYDTRAAIQTVYRILKPGGVLITTIPGISPISRYDMERWGFFWNFTSLSAQRLFEEVFQPGYVQTRSYGNVLAAAAFLYGMATEELKAEEMEYFDPDYEVIIGVRAEKPAHQT